MSKYETFSSRAENSWLLESPFLIGNMWNVTTTVKVKQATKTLQNFYNLFVMFKLSFVVLKKKTFPISARNQQFFQRMSFIFFRQWQVRWIAAIIEHKSSSKFSFSLRASELRTELKKVETFRKAQTFRVKRASFCRTILIWSALSLARPTRSQIRFSPIWGWSRYCKIISAVFWENPIH